MPYAVAINRSAERELKSLAPDIARRVGNRLQALAENPRPAQSKRLKGSPNFRLRVGDYRVVYSVDDAEEKVTIIAVGHRREVYRRRR
ncbi:MAG: type II toxin-antitoxin system RelE/ParE family toxin [Rubrobacter sp.]|nr:type II toxin-antitoxin system RelE/ParE family toxin [Rubrobacter sp.]MDQ3302849.1 type II toxin-antitoxin system RelE/ParE family toxin [Actinomycetota bacterium]